MPTALGALRRHVSATAVVAVVVAATAIIGAAAVASFVGAAAVASFVGAAPAATAAITIFLAFLLGGAKEPEGPFGHRVLLNRGGVDFFFRGGVGSIPGEATVAVLLRLFLEQEPEVFVVGLGFVVLGDDFEVELLCVPMQRSECLVRRRRIILRRQFLALGDGVEGRGIGTRGRGERGEPIELEPEEEEIAMATGSWGFLRCWLREEDEFVVKGVSLG